MHESIDSSKQPLSEVPYSGKLNPGKRVSKNHEAFQIIEFINSLTGFFTLRHYFIGL